MIRGADNAATVLIIPKVPEMKVVLGSPRLGWFRALKSSQRYSNRTRSVICVVLKIDMSRL